MKLSSSLSSFSGTKMVLKRSIIASRASLRTTRTPNVRALFHSSDAVDAFLNTLSEKLDHSPMCCLVSVNKDDEALVKAQPLALTDCDLASPASLQRRLGKMVNWDFVVLAVEVFGTSVARDPIAEDAKLVDGELCMLDAAQALGLSTREVCMRCPFVIQTEKLWGPGDGVAAGDGQLLCSLRPGRATAHQRFVIAIKSKAGRVEQFMIERPFGSTRLIGELPPPAMPAVRVLLGENLNSRIMDQMLQQVVL